MKTLKAVSRNVAADVRRRSDRTTTARAVRLVTSAATLALIAAVMTGCERNNAPPASDSSPPPLRTVAPDPLSLALAPHDGDGPVDKEIQRYQEQVRNGQNRRASLERLGWAFVAKARGSFDTGFYKLAEACADVLDSDSPGCPEALLLRGHVLQNLHRFKEAVTAYQSMVDMRPDLQSYSRIAHVRWLTGDLEGAIEMMRAAVSASSPTDADSAAWANSRLAGLELQSGDTDSASL